MRRNPVLSRASVAAVIAAVCGILKFFGVEIPEDVAAQLVEVVLALAPLVATLWAAWSARRHVTPVADPRDNDGNLLVPVPLIEESEGRHKA